MNVRDYVEHLKGKPEHHRRQIALGSAAGLTLLVALGWMTTLLSSGVLALDDDSFQNESFSTAAGEVRTMSQGLAGAAAALEFDGEAGGEITTIETNASSTLDRTVDTGDATVIPF